jgi:hypothetical protein
LQKYADDVYHIEELEQEILKIKNLNSSQIIDSKPMISYEEAVKYLMKSIQLCIKQKKSPCFSQNLFQWWLKMVK